MAWAAETSLVPLAVVDLLEVAAAARAAIVDPVGSVVGLEEVVVVVRARRCSSVAGVR